MNNGIINKYSVMPDLRSIWISNEWPDVFVEYLCRANTHTVHVIQCVLLVRAACEICRDSQVSFIKRATRVRGTRSVQRWRQIIGILAYFSRSIHFSETELSLGVSLELAAITATVRNLFATIGRERVALRTSSTRKKSDRTYICASAMPRDHSPNIHIYIYVYSLHRENL